MTSGHFYVHTPVHASQHTWMQTHIKTPSGIHTWPASPSKKTGSTSDRLTDNGMLRICQKEQGQVTWPDGERNLCCVANECKAELLPGYHLLVRQGAKLNASMCKGLFWKEKQEMLVPSLLLGKGPERRLRWAERLPAKPFSTIWIFYQVHVPPLQLRKARTKALKISMQAERRRQLHSTGLPTPGLWGCSARPNRFKETKSSGWRQHDSHR